MVDSIYFILPDGRRVGDFGWAVIVELISVLMRSMAFLDCGNTRSCNTSIRISSQISLRNSNSC